MKRRNSCYFAVIPHTYTACKVTATVHSKCSVKMKKTLKLWVEDEQKMCSELVATCAIKHLACTKTSTNGPPENLTPKPFTASQGWLHKFRNQFGLKNIKITEGLPMKTTPTFMAVLEID